MKLFKLRLIDDWKHCYKYLSVQLGVLLTILGVAYEYLPMLQQYLPEGWFKYAAGIIVVARVIKQGSDNAKSTPE